MWHYALHAVAAAILLAIGTPLLWVAWRVRGSQPGTRSPGAPETDTTTSLLRIAAGLSYAAAAIHIAVAPEHFTESAPVGIAFGVLALFQLATGALLQVGSFGRRLKPTIIIVNLGATLMWFMTRTSGLPFLPDLASPESIGLADAAATAFEIALAATLLGLLWMRQRTPRFAPIASIGIVPVLGLVGIFTLLAVAGPASLHAH